MLPMLQLAARRTRSGVACLALPAILVPASLLAQSAPSARSARSASDPLAGATTAFVLTRGADTIAIERVERTPSRLRGELAITRAARFVYDATLTRDALVPRIELTAYMPASPAPVMHGAIDMHGDTALAELGGGQVQRITTRPGAIPWVNPSFALIAQLVRRARVLGGTSVTVPLFNMQGGVTTPATVSRIGADSVVVSLVDVQLRLRVAPDGALLGGVVPSQGVTIRRIDGPRAASLRVAAPDYSAPAGAPYRAVEVVVPTESGVTLGGTLTLPTDVKPPYPAVVTITGSGLQDRDESIAGVSGYRPFRDIADTLSRRGIAVLRLDDRGYGASRGNPSNATTADFADDIRAALDFLRKRDDIDSHRLFLLGHSEGGDIAPMIAAADPALRGIVLMAGTSRPGKQIIESQIRYGVENDRAIRPAARDSVVAARMRAVEAQALRTPWLRYFLSYDPSQTARQVRIPVLILQGGTDKQVPPGNADELAADFRAGGDQDVTVRVFPGLDHLFLPDPSGNPAGYAALPVKKVPAEVRGLIADWIATRARR